MTTASANHEFPDVVQSVLELFSRLTKSFGGQAAQEDLERAIDDARREALRVARELQHRSVASAAELTGHRATRTAIHELLDAGIRTPRAVEMYALASRHARELLVEFDRTAKVAEIVRALVDLSRGAGVVHADLEAASEVLRQQSAGEQRERAAVEAFVDDLQDVIAVIEAEREQGDDPPIAQDELERRLGVTSS